MVDLILESAKKIFNNKIKDTILSVVNKSKGANHFVYVFFCEKNNYILRLPRKNEKSKFIQESIALKKFYELKIPVPKIYHVEHNILIEEFIEGVDLSELKLSQIEYKKLYFEIGKQIKKMHSITTQGYGFFDLNFKGKYLSWYAFLKEDFIHNLNTLREKNLITDVLKTEMMNYFESKKESLDIKNPKLLHSDLAENNIIVDENKNLKGFIDASDCISGDPMYDLAIMYYNNQKRFRYMLDGYGKKDVDMNKIKFYVFYHLVWLFYYHSKNKKHNFCKKDIKKLLVLMRKNELEKDIACVEIIKNKTKS